VAVALLLAFQKLHWTWLIHAYLTGVAVITLNAVRTLGAHRYVYTGEELTFLQQLLDSLTYPTRPWLNELWAPVGLRFHALHHLFPSLPYHALGRAHRRLMAHLPADSAYRHTIAPGLWPVLRDLWRNARESQK
jgi:fatty acid desaturase